MMNTNLRPRFLHRTLTALTLAVLMALSNHETSAAAEAPAGKVVAVAGQVTAGGEDGSIRGIAKDDPIFAGDTISTGPNSRARIVFSDDGVIFLRPSSRFVIKSYRNTGDPQQDESKFSLVRGGFRSVTGAIGKANTKNYEMETPVATIGIRGTDHEGRFCAGDCADLTDVGVSPPADGLYTGTNTGETAIGNQNFGAGQYGYTNPTGQTFQLPEPPPILVKDPLLPPALTDKGDEKNASEEKPEEEKPVEQEKPADQDKPADQQTQGQPATDGGEGTNSGEEGFEIPAQPPTTRMVECQ